MVTHIAYEVVALERAASLLNGDPRALEASLLHARLLREFFYSDWDPYSRFAGSDVFAEHYFPDNTFWRGVRNRVPPTVGRTWQAIDKQLSHITRERADPTKTQDLVAAVPGIRAELLAVWGNFLARLAGSPRHAMFQAEYATWQTRIP
jgi:hypothetical protein